MKDREPKHNQRGHVPIRAETFVFTRDTAGKVNGLKSGGTHILRADQVFSNRKRNRLDQIRWQKEHGRS